MAVSICLMHWLHTFGCDVGDSDMARPRLIDRAGVLQASLDLADERGLDAVTMQAVADRLGVTPMALYRHVHNKADLLDGLVERLLDEIANSRPNTDADSDDGLIEIGRAVRSVALMLLPPNRT